MTKENMRKFSELTDAWEYPEKLNSQNNETHTRAHTQEYYSEISKQ